MFWPNCGTSWTKRHLAGLLAYRACPRTVERVEDTLSASGQFSLPGHKALTEDLSLEVVVVDVSETPCERPKKIEAVVQREEEATHP